MANILNADTGLIFMKIGIHAREDIEDIIARKKQEYRDAGMIFWGYGGNTCYPTTYVQPFVKLHPQTFLVMHKMNSNHWAEPELATEYSKDGINWKSIPKGIQIRGSRFAMVLGDLEEVDFELNLKNLVVGIGRSQGSSGDSYIKGRVDKGCFEYHESGEKPDPENEVKKIDLVAPLKEPYAVFLRRTE